MAEATQDKQIFPILSELLKTLNFGDTVDIRSLVYTSEEQVKRSAAAIER